MFRNAFFNTRPCVLHNPSENDLWDVIVNMFFQTCRKKIKLRDDLSIVTWNNKLEISLIERSLDHLGLSCKVLGKGVNPWNNTLKIKLIRDFLPRVNTKFVMGIDAFDVIVMRDPGEAVNLLGFYGADMVFNATCGIACSSKRLVDFCDEEFAGYPMRHLNAGAWVARTDFCREFFNEVDGITYDDIQKEDYSTGSPLGSFSKSEQLRIKLVFENFYPKVTIDYCCKVFQILNHIQCAELGDHNGVEIDKMYA